MNNDSTPQTGSDDHSNTVPQPAEHGADPAVAGAHPTPLPDASPSANTGEPSAVAAAPAIPGAEDRLYPYRPVSPDNVYGPTAAPNPYRPSAPYSPYAAFNPSAVFPGPASLPPRSANGGRAKLAAGALALVLAAGGVGGGVATLIAHNTTAGVNSSQSNVQAAAQPIAQAPNGTIASVAAKVLPSVVQIRVSVRGSGDVGSGVVLSSDGNILTNNHVVQAAANAAAGAISVVFQDGTTAPASIVGRDPSADIAVIKVANKTDLTPISIGNSSNLVVGQNVVAVGSPLGLSGTVTSGIVSALNRPVSATGESPSANQGSVIDAIQTDAPINPGNSGGPLVNMNGELIGVNSAIASLGATQGSQSGSIGLGFAIPVDHAQRIAGELITHGVATQAVLGAAVMSAPNGTQGAVIGNITPNSPAASAGLSTGDTVTKIDNQLIDSSNALVAAIRSHNPGDTVTLTVANRNQTLTATLGSQTVEAN